MKCKSKKMAAGGVAGRPANAGAPNAKAMANANAKANLAGRFGMKSGGAVRGMGAATKGAGKGPWG